MKKLFRSDIPAVRTIVVKVGSRILAEGTEGERDKRITALVDAIAPLHNAGIRVILVSSGAIAHGVLALKLPGKPREIPLKQACASIGQIRLMGTYAELFGRHNILVGQVLLTWADLRDKVRYLNLRNTLFTLIDNNCVPIINENDSVGIDEIKFGDNDTLGAQIAMLTGADLFVNLTDLNGLYTANPKKDPTASHIPLVEKLTADIMALADADGTTVGTGGMVTKLRAAQTLAKAGIASIIGDGFHRTLLDVIREPALGTLFLAEPEKMSSRHRWIAFAGRSTGTIDIDDGAEHALCAKGKSLLAAGIRGVEGAFKTGDMIDIRNLAGVVVARGITDYPAADVSLIKGCKASEIAGILSPERDDPVVIHRNNLVLVQ